jgi:hypothetical protein
MRAGENEIQSLAPPGLPQQQRRHLDRILNKLVDREACSVCDRAYPDNSRLAYGLDHVGGVVMVGDCCIDQVTIVLGHGFFSERRYGTPRDTSRDTSHASKPAHGSNAWAQIDEAIALRQKAITDATGEVERHAERRVERRGGVEITGKVLLMLDSSWRIDDRAWFEKNSTRSHRARMPFAGEDYGQSPPGGCTSIVLVRQIKPGTRVRQGFYLNTALLPVPDDEALIHAMFEIAARREPAPATMQAFCALRDKYAGRSSCGSTLSS